MFIERQQLLACVRVPNFACAIVGSCDEFVARLVESTVCEWEEMSAQYLKERELLFLVL